MRSEAQREASRENGKKSKGPKTPPGKDKSKMNGLKHGLRAEQVVLPGEDPAEFEAELKGWADDWKPAGHTKAVLVERAAVATWRLRRCVRAEAELVLKLAVEARAEVRDDDDDIPSEVDIAEDLLDDAPERALRELKSSPAGIDRLIARWDGLAGGPDDWDRRNHHDGLMRLLGHSPKVDLAEAGPMATASHRLTVANGHANDCDDADDRESRTCG